MVSRTVQNCEQIMRAMVNSGITNQISKNSLERFITVFRGGDPRTIKNCIHSLKTLEYVTQVNPNVFKVNLVKVNGLLEKAIRDGGQKRLL